MNALRTSLFLITLLASGMAFGQDHPTLPHINLKTMDGKTVNTADFANDGKPILISFWATWCKPCIAELTAISDYYTDWQTETGVKIIAISIDDARNSSKVSPFVNGKGWEYEVYIDENSDLKRALNITAVPHTLLLNDKKEIVWQHSGYAPGGEEEVHEEIKKVAGK